MYNAFGGRKFAVCIGKYVFRSFMKVVIIHKKGRKNSCLGYFTPQFRQKLLIKCRGTFR